MKQVLMKWIVPILAAMPYCTTGQTVIGLSESEAVTQALNNSAAMKAADLGIKRQRQSGRAEMHFPDPELTLESPTGEFMTAGIMQDLDFPVVYFMQGGLNRARSTLAEKNRNVVRAQVILGAKSAYLQLQHALGMSALTSKKDSVMSRISEAADREFSAGQADFVAKTYAKAKQGEARDLHMQSLSEISIAQFQLRQLTGLNEEILPTPILEAAQGIHINLDDSARVHQGPLIEFRQQSLLVAERSLKAERSRILPGLSVGYLNPGFSDTETSMRMRYGISVPLWFWQRGAAIGAAKTSVKIEEQELEEQRREVSLRIESEKSRIARYGASVMYYESEGIRQADELINSSQRMFSAGQTDYMTHLRTLNDAYDMKLKYLDALRNYRQAIINLNYLTGQE